MKEIELHWFWASGKIKQRELICSTGEVVQILYPGAHNSEPGPDFKNARIKMGSITLAGDVEIHIKSSDWFNHKHHLDKNYNAVVLHLVLTLDRKAQTANGLEPKHLIIEESELGLKPALKNPKNLLCNKQLNVVPKVLAQEWLFDLFKMRLNKKINAIENKFNFGNSHLEILFNLIFNAAGFSTHSKLFNSAFTCYNFIVWKNECHAPKHVLFLLWNSFPNSESHFNFDFRYEKEYLFQKYNLNKTKKTRVENKFYRPKNSPYMRSFQLAFILYLLNKKSFNYSDFLGEKQFVRSIKTNIKSFCEHISIDANILNIKALCNIWNNSFYWFFYWVYPDDNLSFLLDGPEHNSIINKFTFDLEIQSRQESQALLYLHENFCTKFRCLSCTFGRYLFERK